MKSFQVGRELAQIIGYLAACSEPGDSHVHIETEVFDYYVRRLAALLPDVEELECFFERERQAKGLEVAKDVAVSAANLGVPS